MLTHKPILAALTLSLAAWGTTAAAQVARQAGQSRPVVVKAQPGQASEPEVRRLVELTGMVEKELASLEPLMEMLKQGSPQVPEKVWAEVREEFKKSFNREAIIKMYTPIYARHFSAAEVRELTAFYGSPLGKRLVAETSLIEAEAFTKGMERGVDLGARVRELLKSKGYDMPST